MEDGLARLSLDGAHAGPKRWGDSPPSAPRRTGRLVAVPSSSEDEGGGPPSAPKRRGRLVAVPSSSEDEGGTREFVFRMAAGYGDGGFSFDREVTMVPAAFSVVVDTGTGYGRLPRLEYDLHGNAVEQNVEGVITPYKPPPGWIQRLNNKMKEMSTARGESPVRWELDARAEACLVCVAVEGDTDWRQWLCNCNVVLSAVLNEDHAISGSVDWGVRPHFKADPDSIPFIRLDGTAHVYENNQDVGRVTLDNNGILFTPCEVSEAEAGAAADSDASTGTIILCTPEEAPSAPAERALRLRL
jgi:hypothetical protein